MGYYHYWGRLDYGPALDEFAAAAKREPNNAEVAQVTGLVHRRQGKFDQALASFKHAAELDPRSVDDLFEQASISYYTRDYPAADRVVARAFELAPDSPDLYALRMANYLNWEGSLDQPRRLMREALSRFELARFGETQLYGDCFDLIAADPAFQEEANHLTAAAFGGIKINYYPFMAFVSHRRRDVAKRRAYADSARSEALAHIERHEETVFVYSTLATMNAFLGHGDEAVQAGRRALDVLPLSKDALFGVEGHVALAQVYTVLGKPDSAVQQPHWPSPRTCPSGGFAPTRSGHRSRGTRSSSAWWRGSNHHEKPLVYHGASNQSCRLTSLHRSGSWRGSDATASRPLGDGQGPRSPQLRFSEWRHRVGRHPDCRDIRTWTRHL
jgi:tetratricopeptide (TPR) repeat protein